MGVTGAAAGAATPETFVTGKSVTGWPQKARAAASASDFRTRLKERLNIETYFRLVFSRGVGAIDEWAAVAADRRYFDTPNDCV
jgi:hypothetical protein